MPKNIVIALLGGALIDGICGVAGLARPWPAAIGGLVAIVILGILGARR